MENSMYYQIKLDLFCTQVHNEIHNEIIDTIMNPIQKQQYQ